MKRFSRNIILSFFLLLTCITAVSAEKQTGPRISIEETSFDAKEVIEGKIIQHTFRVINTGDQPLEINKVQPG